MPHCFEAQVLLEYENIRRCIFLHAYALHLRLADLICCLYPPQSELRKKEYP